MSRIAEFVGPHAPPATAFCPPLLWLAESGNRYDFEQARRNYPDILVLPRLPWGICHHWDATQIAQEVPPAKSA